MQVTLVDEYSEKGHLIHAGNFPGAYVRGREKEEALAKLPAEIRSYMLWAGMEYAPVTRWTVVQSKKSSLAVEDADSDVIFDSERLPLTEEEYLPLKALALKSAQDFQLLFDSVREKDAAVCGSRRTFYGEVPVTPRQMYTHTMNVNSYYFDQLGVNAPNGPDILSCRILGFERLEQQSGFLARPSAAGSWEEEWSLRKLLRRFVWHDRIHARAMYRTSCAVSGSENTADPFFFGQ